MKKKPKEEIPKTWKGLVYKLFFYKTKELLFLVIIILAAIITLQILGFNFSVLKVK